MSYSTFNPTTLTQFLYNKTNKLGPEKTTTHCCLNVYVKLDDCSNMIEKRIGARLYFINDEYRACFARHKNIVNKDKDEFVKLLVEKFMCVKSCCVCLRLIIKDKDVVRCNRCEVLSICDLSAFEKNCPICQEEVVNDGKVLSCCGNILHMTCYKKYRYKQSNYSYCDECERQMIPCPLCRQCIHCSL